MTSPATSILLFYLIQESKKINVDYTPKWGRGQPSSYIDNVTFPRVISDRPYKYRVVKGGTGGGGDLGVKDAYKIQPDGSQELNFLEWNSGYGIADSQTIQVYAVDPEIGNQYLVAQWN